MAAESPKPGGSPHPPNHTAEGGVLNALSFGPRTEITIGRDVDCDVVIKDVKASRKHCRLVRRNDGFILEDLGSKNGTYVDGERITKPTPLRPDQAFKIGDTLFYLSK